MKKILHLAAFITAAFVFNLNSFAVPLHGSYTVGAGGNYPLISDAVAAVDSLGVSGPVTFRIFSGTYHGTNYLREVTNSNSSNTVTFESFAANADSVVITDPSEYTFRIEGAKNLIIRNLTIQNITLREDCRNIHILNNKFSDQRIQMIDGQILGFHIKNNFALAGIQINSAGILMQAVTISDNDFSPLASYVILNNINNLTITGNKNLANVTMDFVNTVDFSGNKMKTNQPGSNVLLVRESGIVFVKNNFFDSKGDAWGISFKGNSFLDFKNNSVRNEGLDTTLQAVNNSGLELLNNIYYNDSPGVSVSLWNNTALYTDYNAYYNGPDIDIIRYNGTEYNLAGFQAATGQGLHSNSYAADFASPDDLHLNSSENGNVLLLGNPDPDVNTDIDGQPRNPLHPYKGADELDAALPVELASFTSVVSGSNVTLNWTTVTENNNSGFQIERTSDMNQWITIFFVNGIGNSNTPVNYSYTDNNLNPGIYNYRLKQTDYNGNFTYYNLSGEVVIGVPQKFSLSQNYPNPFNPETMIIYNLPSEQSVSLKIYDMTGREVSKLVNEVQSAGRYQIRFNSGNLSSGIYYLKMKAGEFSDVKKLVIMK